MGNQNDTVILVQDAWSEEDIDMYLSEEWKKKKAAEENIAMWENIRMDSSVEAVKCTDCGLIQNPEAMVHNTAHPPIWEKIRRWKTVDEMMGART